MSNLEKHFYSSSLTGAEKALYAAGYSFILNNGGSADEAHAHGLKQIAKIGKLRKLAANGQITNA